MTVPRSRSIERMPGAAALWLGAGLAAVCLHAGAVLWLLNEPTIVQAQDAPTPAILIDLAPEAVAVLNEDTEISPDQTSDRPSEASDEADAAEDARPTPEDAIEEPEPEAAELSGEPTPLPAVPPAPTADLPVAARPVPVPVARPRPPAKTAAEIPRKPVQKKPPPKEPAARATVQAQARVTKASRTAALQSSSSLFSSSASPARWEGRLRAYLERRKTYPPGARARGEVGTVYVRFQIDGEGNVLTSSLVGSSGFASLDEAVLSLIRRASPVPAPPPEANRLVIVPITFK